MTGVRFYALQCQAIISFRKARSPDLNGVPVGSRWECLIHAGTISWASAHSPEGSTFENQANASEIATGKACSTFPRSEDWKKL
eukprot:IDg2208t1